MVGTVRNGVRGVGGGDGCLRFSRVAVLNLLLRDAEAVRVARTVVVASVGHAN